MKRLFFLFILVGTLLPVKAFVYSHPDLHLYFEMDPETKEAVVGQHIEDDNIAKALVYPPIGDPWWDNPTWHWKNIVIPSTIEYGNDTYTVVGVVDHAFCRSDGIYSITLPETIRYIEDEAFSMCINLRTINIPDSVKEIRNGTFFYCKSLEVVQLPEAIRMIASKAFSDCVSLSEVNIPGKCTYIGNDAFTWCKKLTNLIVEDGTEILKIGYSYNLGYGDDSNDNYQNPKYRGLFADCPIKRLYWGRNVEFPEILDNIYPPFKRFARNGFDQNGNALYITTGVSISSVEFGEFVTEIPDELFRGANISNDMILPPYLEKIGSNAFKDGFNTMPIEITLSETIQSIGDNAFSGLNSSDCVSFVHCETLLPPVLGNFAFGGINDDHIKNTIIDVPSGKGNAYRTDESWGKYLIVDSADELVTVNVKTSGTLYSRLLAQDIQINQINKLKLKGSLNNDDWDLLKDATSLYYLDISELSITSIPKGQFSNNKNLVEIKIPETIEYFQSEDFKGCTHLSGTLLIPNSCTSIGKCAFQQTGYEKVVFSSAVNVSDEAFSYCKRLKNLKIEGEGTIIGKKAFQFSGIRLLEIGKGVTIRNNAFYYNPNLKEVIFHDGINSLGDDLFESCNNITKVVYKGHISSIGSSKFSSNLSEVYISDLKSWLNLSFPNIESSPLYYAKHVFVNGKEIDEIVIPDNTKTIRDYAFYNCNTLRSVKFNKELVSIGKSSFGNCANLEKIEFPSALNSICENAFSGCSALEKINFPISVSSIASQAFYNCSKISIIQARWDSPFSVSDNTFEGVSPNCFLYIPIGTATKYRNAGWGVIPNVKEAGILTVSMNSGGSLENNSQLVREGTDELLFTPYKSFYITITPDQGFSLKKVKLNGVNVFDDIVNGKLLIEEPEENITLSVTFADNSIAAGDVNGDGVVNVTDAICIANYILKNRPSGFIDYIADINDDDEINITDIVSVVKLVLKK